MRAMNERQKQLREAYKTMKKPMGVYLFQCLATGKAYLGAAHDLRGVMNGTRFKLDSGFHPCRGLLADWKQYGSGGFRVEVLEELPYDEKDEARTDYRGDLETLRDLLAGQYPDHEFLRTV